MPKFSNDKNINELVKKLIKQGWQVRLGKKHHILIAPNNRRLAIPSSPSDCRAFLSFTYQIRHLI